MKEILCIIILCVPSVCIRRSCTSAWNKKMMEDSTIIALSKNKFNVSPSFGNVVRVDYYFSISKWWLKKNLFTYSNEPWRAINLAVEKPNADCTHLLLSSFYFTKKPWEELYVKNFCVHEWNSWYVLERHCKLWELPQKKIVPSKY